MLPEFLRDPFEYVRECQQIYGDVFRLPFPLRETVFVCHPDHVKHVMNNPCNAYSMGGNVGARLNKVIGASVATLEGDVFRQRRKLIAPLFGARSLSTMADGIANEFVGRIDRWEIYAETGAVIDLQYEIAKVTLPAFMRAMFSIKVTDREVCDLDVDLHAVLRAAAAVCFICTPPNLIPAPGVDSFPKSWFRLRKWVSQQIDYRIGHPIERQDLFETLLNAQYDDGSAIRRKDLIQETAMLIAGGYETVVAALSWTLALLDGNREARVKLYEEVDALDGRQPTYNDLQSLTWAKACFDEGQRLQGHPMNPRFAMRDDWIDGYFIPRGTLIGVPMYTLHRDTRWWQNPDSYDPNRFANPAQVQSRPATSFLPFGFGPHRCIGSALGYMNAQFLLAIIHQRYCVNFPIGWQPRHSPKFSIAVEGGLPATLTVRKDSSRK
ncbi:cytochrome P450 [Mycobacterium kansasii]|nr:cytochrome P450 [Mycobacterium kansasii]ARG65347.1 cytochrome P450 [Mycobacterium kansasii]ARG73102.1 cytochrome P450 [Mycobacterium kansasii]ARG77894.1 cytochrome P450 [Mycobacterium kansasii]ARG83344.1 cytochrome P450 [Mycobacterium kansasii]